MRPELVTDELLGALPDALVLFYLKLWLLTDDAGYFELRPRQIAATLYPYRASARRLRQVEGWLMELAQLGRIEPLECGAHAVVRTIPRHRIQGGSKAYTYRSMHRAKCAVHTSTDKYPSDDDYESDDDSRRAPARGSSMRERATAILEDPDSSAEAKAGARMMLSWAAPQ